MSSTDVFLKLAGEWVMEFHPPVKRRMVWVPTHKVYFIKVCRPDCQERVEELCIILQGGFITFWSEYLPALLGPGQARDQVRVRPEDEQWPDDVGPSVCS